VLIEDCAQALGADYQGRRAGSWGDFGCFSFYPTKNLGAYGDAGLVTTRRREHDRRLRMLRHHGSRQTYLHERVGWNSRLDELQAAVLRAKLRAWTRFNAARRRTPRATGRCSRARRSSCPPRTRAARTSITSSRSAARSATIREALAKAGIASSIFYPMPLHRQPVYEALGKAGSRCPLSEAAARRCSRCPSTRCSTRPRCAHLRAPARCAEARVHQDARRGQRLRRDRRHCAIAVRLTAAQVRRLADRHFGVGCDQLLVVERPTAAGCDFRYRIFNADGGEVEQCGNGARCFVKFVHAKGLTDEARDPRRDARRRDRAALEADGEVSVDMGAPAPPRLALLERCESAARASRWRSSPWATRTRCSRGRRGGGAGGHAGAAHRAPRALSRPRERGLHAGPRAASHRAARVGARRRRDAVLRHRRLRRGGRGIRAGCSPRRCASRRAAAR
jgi:hypothetical protein